MSSVRVCRVGVVLSAVAAAAVVTAPAARAATTVVTTYPDLRAAVAAGGTVRLAADLAGDTHDPLQVTVGKPVVLDLRGHTLSITDDDSLSYTAAIGVPTGAVLTVSDPTGAGSLTAEGAYGAAGIGGNGSGQGGGSITVNGGTVRATGGYAGAGIGGSAYDTGICSRDPDGETGFAPGSSVQRVRVTGGTVIAAGGGNAAGIGGSDCGGSGGPVSVSGGAVTATGGAWGAGIGGGAGYGLAGATGGGGSLTVSGGTVDATGGLYGAGIGGGDDGPGGTVSVTGGVVTSQSGPSAGSAVGSGAHTGPAGAVSVTGGSLTAVGTDNAVGVGTTSISTGSAGRITTSGPGGATGTFRSLTNAGEVVVPGETVLTVPAGVTAVNSGTLTLSGALDGTGTVRNTGRIVGDGAVRSRGSGPAGSALLVSVNNYLVQFDVNGGTGATPSARQVFAPTVAAANRTLPAGPQLSGKRFVGWFTDPLAGVRVTATTDLASVLGVTGPTTVTLYAQYGVTAKTWNQVRNNVGAGGVVTLGTDISAVRGQGLYIGIGRASAIDLAGHSLVVNPPYETIAAIDVPAGATFSVRDSVGGGRLTVRGGDVAAGIGGSRRESAGTLWFTGGTTVAHGGAGAPAIGGGAAYQGVGAGDGADVHVLPGATVVADGGGVSAFGGGSGDGDPTFGSLVNGGTVTLPAGAELDVPADVTLTNTGTFDGTGTIHNLGTIVGGGTVADGGQGPAGTALLVTDHNYTATFVVPDGAGPAPAARQVFDDSFVPTGLPAGPKIAGQVFTGWWTAPTGGTKVLVNSDLDSVVGQPGPAGLTLYARYRTA